MRTRAIVTKIEGETATVRTTRTSACEGCHKSAEGCSICSVMGKGKPAYTQADNTLGAEVGDAVVIESATGRMLWYAVLVFLLPIVGCFAGYWIASLFDPAEWVLALSAVGGFAAAFLIVRIYSELRKSKTDVTIVEILPKASDEAPRGNE